MPDFTKHTRERLPDGLASREQVLELSHQLEDVYQEGLASGMSPLEAETRAVESIDWAELGRRLAPLARPKRDRKRGFPTLGLLQDVKHGVRLLKSRPGTSVLASVTLALAIGANAVCYSFVQSFLFQPLAAHEPDRLARIYGSLPGSLPYAAVSYTDFLSIRSQRDIFEDVLAEKLIPLSLASPSGSQRLWGYLVSGNYFQTLGIVPAAGSFFAEDAEARGGEPVVVVSYAFWNRALGGRADVVGTSVSLNGQPFTIVGVAPADFTGTNTGLAPSLWAPASGVEWLMPGFDLLSRNNRSFQSIGRLKRGTTVAEAAAALDVLAERLASEYPENRGYGFNVLAEAEGGVHPIMRGGFIGFSGVLVLVVGLVLALACANVAGLALARTAYRRREMGLRMALGATRARLSRQLIIESLLLSAGGCLLGLIVARYATTLLRGLELPTDLPLHIPVAVEPRVVAFAVAVSLLTGIFVGLVPALHAGQPNLSMKRRGRIRNAFVVSQIALSTVLLVGTGLFMRNLDTARDIDLGFDPEGLVLASVDLDLEGYTLEEGRRFFEELRQHVRALPGVDSAAFAEMVPFDLNINMHEMAPEGYEPPPDGSTPAIDRNIVSPGYFETMGTALLEGRDFAETDDADAPRVVIVNDALARRFWPDESAVGKRMGRPGGPLYEVVGVVEVGKYLTLGEEPKAFFFYPFLQREALAMSLVARTSGEPAAILASIRERVRQMDPGLPVFNVKPMEEHLQIALAPARAGVAIFASFGSVALGLATLGLYALLAFVVAQQTHDIGIRRALGAPSRHVFGFVLRYAVGLAVLGVGIGLVVSLGLSSVVASLLYGISAIDPRLYLAVALLLVATAAVAAIAPARRATRVDPLVALRHD